MYSTQVGVLKEVDHEPGQDALNERPEEERKDMRTYASVASCNASKAEDCHLNPTPSSDSGA